MELRIAPVHLRILLRASARFYTKHLSIRRGLDRRLKWRESSVAMASQPACIRASRDRRTRVMTRSIEGMSTISEASAGAVNTASRMSVSAVTVANRE